jgi:cell division protease FtsH
VTSRIVPEADLPVELGLFDAVEAAYPAELAEVEEAIVRRLPVLVECDKELVPFFYRSLRDRWKRRNLRAVYLDGRPPPDAQVQLGVLQTMVGQLRDAVRGPVGERVVVLPHLDLLTTSSGGITSEAREVVALLYENPEVLWLGFKDSSFPLPEVISNLFPRRSGILGVPRERLRYLVTQRESKKLAPKSQGGLDPYLLYKYVSGVNAIRLRRLLTALDGVDYPDDAVRAFGQLRSSTLNREFTLPDIDLRKDIGGYTKVKDRLEKEILTILATKDASTTPEEARRIESLLPRGMIFWGPPGTGKTLFAKAMATALGAAVNVVSGPELKSRWVGESEENLRRVFVAARQSAPSVIIFDELDSFATARGTYTGSGVEHSMVNQLLTEMDGFRKEELVFVVGTTNFVESLDPALLRPGRFEFHLHIPYPDVDDRRAIFQIYDKKLELQLSERALDYAVKRTADLVEGQQATRYSGDHIQAICRQLARRRLRERMRGPTETSDIETALTAYLERPELTALEERTVATHEAGHAVTALFCPHSPPIDRISIRGDLAGALGFVQYGDRAHRYVVTRGQLLDSIATLFGGREAEALLLDDLSIGSSQDLERATAIARFLVEELGMGSDEVGARRYRGVQPDEYNEKPQQLSEDALRTVERAVRQILDEQRARCRTILSENRALVETLRDMLVEKKVLDREAFAPLVAEAKVKRG